MLGYFLFSEICYTIFGNISLKHQNLIVNEFSALILHKHNHVYEI